MTDARLPGAYGSFASGGGAALYGTVDALRSLAACLRQRTCTSTELHLDRAPDDAVEEARIEQIKITILTADEKVAFHRVNGTVEVSGGDGPMNKLAQTLENLAEATRRIDDPVMRHVDLEYFPGHGFLDVRSMWMTVLLIDGFR